MASEDEIQDTIEIDQSECKFIAERIKEYPEVLEKSQLPGKKAKKRTAIDKIVSEYRQLYGKDMTSKVLMKKVGNMKTRMKKKIDKNKTGYRRIPPLLPWENIMMEAMNTFENPTVAKIPGGLELGVSLHLHERHNTDHHSPPTPTPPPPPPQAAVTYGKRKLAEGGSLVQETEETKKLSISQLQRLVLLEQLKVARLQQEYFNAKLKNKILPIPSPEFYSVNDQTFEVLQ